MRKESSSNRILIKVRDSGKGIAEKDIPYIFDRFFRTKDSKSTIKGGTGVGLALSNELSRVLGGEIQVESQLGKGSTFSLFIPRNKVESEVPETSFSDDFESFQKLWKEKDTVPQQQPTSIISDAPTLLIVEDSLDMQEFLISILNQQFNVIIANNGKEAIELLEGGMRDERIEMIDGHGVQSQSNSLISQSTTHPSLIISDIMMPEMDGISLLKVLKSSSQYAHIPVIMLTARSNEETKLKSLRIGVDDYLTKPFSPEELLARTQNLISHAQVRQGGEQSIEKSEVITKKTLQASKITPVFSEEEQQWLAKLEETILKEIDKNEFYAWKFGEQLAVSESKLNRKIKSLTGMTPHQYIRELKLHQARKMLENRKYKSLAEYAYALGFKDPHYFSSIFEKRFGKKVKAYLK